MFIVGHSRKLMLDKSLTKSSFLFIHIEICWLWAYGKKSNYMKKIIIILFVVLMAFASKASHVSYKDAEKAAKAYYYQTVNAFRATEWNDISLTCVVNPNVANNKYNLYIFDVNVNEGYIVVSSNDQITPVLAYSFECPFNMDNMSPGQAGYLEYYSDANDYADKNAVDQGIVETNMAEWNYLLAYNPQTRTTRDVVTSPILLDGIVWEQGWPFNSMCPEKNNNYHNHAPVGPVATATCHIMKYWNWPSSGTGSYTHSNFANGGNGNITVNFANETYDWYSIPNDPSSAENTELGKICFHVGVAVKTYWEADGSGSQTSYVPTALNTYFRYSTDIEYKTKSSYSDTDWKAMLKQQIDQKYPMVYSGSPATWGSAGHAWNCDGYQINGETEKFHMQWGLGINGGNGFYTLDNLLSTALSGDAYNYINSQEVIINIHPNQTFSECQSATIAGVEGTFDDGSRIYQYGNNMDCVYTIYNNECNSSVELSFAYFNLANGDLVNIYDGNDGPENLIATFDMNNVPNTTLLSETSKLIIKFHTDGQDVSDGWKVNYVRHNLPNSINVESSNELMGRVYGSGDYLCGEEISISAIANDGYIFMRWDDGNTENPRTVTVEGNLTLVAIWAILTELEISTCNAYTLGEDYEFNTTGTHYGFFMTENDIDSVVRLNLTIEQPLETSIVAVATNNANKNVVKWNSISYYTMLGYIVYRQDAYGEYEIVDSVAVDGECIWTDIQSNTAIRPYRYAVATYDSCGNISTMSASHRTIHLQISLGQGNSRNLSWTDYEGMEFSTYRVYRGTSIEDMEMIMEMSAENHTYTDFDVQHDYLYQIEIVQGMKSVVISRSNIVSTNPGGITDIDDIDISEITIFPNPATDILNITSSETISEIEIVNVMGQVVKRIEINSDNAVCDVEDLKAGVYIVRISTASATLSQRKFIKE